MAQPAAVPAASRLDVAIPLAFPDYKIAVPVPEVKVPNPFGTPFRIPKQTLKLPELGHAGILFFKASGLTKYYEYGRYDPAQLGLTRKLDEVPDLVIASNGKPSRSSLSKALAYISSRSGQNGRISGAYIERPAGSFEKMLAYAQKRMAENSDPKREPYDLTGNSCMHFALSTAEASGANMPWILDPRPNSFIGEVQDDYPALEYKPGGQVSVKAIELV